MSGNRLRQHLILDQFLKNEVDFVSIVQAKLVWTVAEYAPFNQKKFSVNSTVRIETFRKKF